MENKKIKGIVKLGPKNINEFQGNKQVSFQLEDHDDWFCVQGPEEGLNVAMKMLVKGNQIEFDFENNLVTNIKVISEAPKQTGNFSDDMTNFEDLLSRAHEIYKERFEIKTEMITVDLEKKYALFKATVIVTHEIKSGEDIELYFEAHGDATIDNLTSKMIQPHFIRMAETRAISRALRWATNNAKVAEEETNKTEDDNTRD